MANLVDSLDSLKGKLSVWAAAAEKSDNADVKAAAAQMREMFNLWERQFPGNLKELFSALDALTASNGIDYIDTVCALFASNADNHTNLTKSLIKLKEWKNK